MAATDLAATDMTWSPTASAPTATESPSSMRELDKSLTWASSVENQKPPPEKPNRHVEKDILFWLSDRLCEDRAALHKRHKTLLGELKSKLYSAGLSAKNVITSGKCEVDSLEPEAEALIWMDTNGFNKTKSNFDGMGSSDSATKDELMLGPNETKIEVALAPTGETCGRCSTSKQKACRRGFQRTSGLFQLPAINLFQPNSFDGTEDVITKMVHNKYFEWFFGLVIVVNMLVMAVEAQYIGLGAGQAVQYQGYTHSKEEIWPGAGNILLGADYCFGIAYTVEVALKLVGLRFHFCDRWNAFDVFIVLMWYCDKIMTFVTLPLDMMMLRLLRLARLMRLIKLIKTISGFDQLFLMITALKGSAFMLAWASLLLTTCMVTFAFVLNQTLIGYMLDDSDMHIKAKHVCFMYFGNFSRSLFSMFELTLGNWVPISRFLMDHVNEWFILFAIVYKLTFGFAVIAVINGCFIKETFKTADADDLLMILQKEKEHKMHSTKMLKLLQAADVSNDGMLDRREWEAACHTTEVKYWLAAQGLNASEAAMLFELMDNGKGTITSEELVKGVGKLKGPASSLAIAIAGHTAVERELRISRHVLDLKDDLRFLKESVLMLKENMDAMHESTSGRESREMSKSIISQSRHAPLSKLSFPAQL